MERSNEGSSFSGYKQKPREEPGFFPRPDRNEAARKNKQNFSRAKRKELSTQNSACRENILQE